MFSENNYVPTVITLTPGIGEAGKTTVYVRRRNATIDTDKADRDSLYIAISSAARISAAPCAGWTPPSASSAPVTVACTTCSGGAWAARR